MPKRSQAGFTLLEVVTVVAILSILVVLAYAGMNRMMPQADLRTAVADVAGQLEAARRQARGNGTQVWVGFLPATTTDPMRVVVYEDWNGNFDPDTFDVTAPRAQLDVEAGTGQRRDKLHGVFRLPEAVRPVAGSEFTGYSKVPVPFRTVTPSATSTGCSFCTSAGGWIEFTAGGRARVHGGTGSGAGLFLGGVDPGGQETKVRYFISITEPYGLVRSFSDA